MKPSKPLLLVGLLVLAALAAVFERGGVPGSGSAGAIAQGDRAVTEAFESHQSNLQVQGSGRVSRILADDNNGSRHQRFIVTLASGHTLLIAHNIDLAPRVAGIRVGDAIAFSGEYEWNEQGGVVHWTHHDPQGEHESGWLRHEGRVYQ